MSGFGKRRAGSGMAVLAVLAFAALFACGGGGGGDKNDDFDFNGTWMMDEVVTQSTIPGFPVGMRGAETARITQTGTGITVVLEGVVPMTGTCDPAAGTFAVAGTDRGATVTMNGAKVDENTVSGEVTIGGGGAFARIAYTMELASRNRAARGVAASGGAAAALASLR